MTKLMFVILGVFFSTGAFGIEMASSQPNVIINNRLPKIISDDLDNTAEDSLYLVRNINKAWEKADWDKEDKERNYRASPAANRCLKGLLDGIHNMEDKGLKLSETIFLKFKVFYSGQIVSEPTAVIEYSLPPPGLYHHEHSFKRQIEGPAVENCKETMMEILKQARVWDDSLKEDIKIAIKNEKQGVVGGTLPPARNGVQ